MKSRFRPFFALILLALVGCAGTRVPMTPQQEYAEASLLHDAESYEEASVQFEEYVRKYPESNNADNAKLQIANGHFQQGKYEEAIAVYQEILTSYPEGDAADQASLAIGDSYFAQGETNEAIEAYENLLLKYPRFSTQVAVSAQDRMNAAEDIEEDMRIISEGADAEKDNAQYDIANISYPYRRRIPLHKPLITALYSDNFQLPICSGSNDGSYSCINARCITAAG